MSLKAIILFIGTIIYLNTFCVIIQEMIEIWPTSELKSSVIQFIAFGITIVLFVVYFISLLIIAVVSLWRIVEKTSVFDLVQLLLVIELIIIVSIIITIIAAVILSPIVSVLPKPVESVLRQKSSPEYDYVGQLLPIEWFFVHFLLSIVLVHSIQYEPFFTQRSMAFIFGPRCELIIVDNSPGFAIYLDYVQRQAHQQQLPLVATNIRRRTVRNWSDIPLWANQIISRRRHMAAPA